jgi:hypothetical protein
MLTEPPELTEPPQRSTPSGASQKGAGWILLTPRMALRLLVEAERFERIAALTPESVKPRARFGNGQ